MSTIIFKVLNAKTYGAANAVVNICMECVL